jgi:hypothetical protein
LRPIRVDRGRSVDRLVRSFLSAYYGAVDDNTANRIIDLQAEITALRGAVRMLIQNVYGEDVRSLAMIREEALRGDDLTVFDKEPGDRGSRYARVFERPLPACLTHSSLTTMKPAAWPMTRRQSPHLNRSLASGGSQSLMLFVGGGKRTSKHELSHRVRRMSDGHSQA